MCWQVQKKLRGCIVFTSSAAAAIASPFTALYAATKSFISSFGASLAVEVRHHGIDVLVFHPSPVNTRCAQHYPISSFCNADVCTHALYLLLSYSKV